LDIKSHEYNLLLLVSSLPHNQLTIFVVYWHDFPKFALNESMVHATWHINELRRLA
jgi:hypothetical protein